MEEIRKQGGGELAACCSRTTAGLSLQKGQGSPTEGTGLAPGEGAEGEE